MSSRALRLALLSLLLLAAACSPSPLESPAERYLAAYFETFPSRATAAGRHEHDDRLEVLDAATRGAWLELNRRAAADFAERLAEPGLDPELRLDYELLERQARRQILAFGDQDRPGRDPLFWTGIASRAAVLLMVRDDRPRAERYRDVAVRVGGIPALLEQGRAALAASDPATIAAELCRMAARQASAAASFYRGSFVRAADSEPQHTVAMKEQGRAAATALDAFAAFLDELAGRATGEVRLGEAYAERFRVVTGVDEPVEEVLAGAEAALEARRAEAARFGRGVWAALMGGEPPADDGELLRRLFARVAEDRAASVEEFVEDYRALIRDSVEFVRARDVVTLPEPLTLHVDRSPDYLLGASVGGVYAAGPYAPPETKTLLFLPTPPPSATADELDAFFRDFNHHFNVMITPHEIVPGHYLQLKWAARHPRKVRALFGDGIYVEGWGTFCERLMLDLGWGDELARLAHLKKQLENIARTIVDIRVHTREMSRDEVLAFVREEALQDEQFAANMWRRAITSSPQLTFYHLGYREVWALYEEVRRARGESFELRSFTDAMMETGPVPLRHVRARLLAEAEGAG